VSEPEPAPDPEVEAKPEPVSEPEPAPDPEVKAKPEPVSEPEPAPDPQVEAMDDPVSESSEPASATLSAPRAESADEPQIEVISEPVVEPFVERPPQEAEAVRSRPARSRRRTEPAASAENADADQELPPGSVIWEKLVLDVRETLCKKVLAQAMLAAKVISFNGFCLHVAFDSRYAAGETILVMREKNLLDMRLAAIAERPGAFVSIERRSGLVTPAQRKQKEDAEALRRETEHNPFIAGILETFDGVLSDVHRLDKNENDEDSVI
jgi:hypothetical protein